MAQPNLNLLTDESTLTERREAIRAERAFCFEVVNRGLIWYESISTEQKAELTTWYHEWLDAPQTLVIPETPTWIQ